MSGPWRAVEEASLNAWPAATQALRGGWLLRAADGYTKRANSATPLYDDPAQPIPPLIEHVEAHYARLGQPSVVRLPPTARRALLDAALDGRGYRHTDPTLVMVRPLASLAGAAAILEEAPLGVWIRSYCALGGAEPAAQQPHAAIVARIIAPCSLALLRAGGEVVACGLAVAEGPWVGLFDLLVAPAQRGQGYGTQLLLGLLAWGGAAGATHGYLQVVAANQGARRLYTRHGFTPLYDYWYRVQPLG